MGASPILITGGAGYIGSHMALNLQDSGMTPIIIDNLSMNDGSLVPSGAIFYQGDVGDQPFVEEILQKHEIQRYYPFCPPRLSCLNLLRIRLKYYLNNTSETARLIQSAIKVGVENFVFSSTAAVYGIPDQQKVSEHAPLAPINPYGASKMMSEKILQDCADAHSLKYGILRYFNVAGADKNLRAGQKTQKATHLIKVATEAALGKRESIEIFGTDFNTFDGTGIRDYIHVSDLVEIHRQTLTLMHETGQSATV